MQLSFLLKKKKNIYIYIYIYIYIAEAQRKMDIWTCRKTIKRLQRG